MVLECLDLNKAFRITDRQSAKYEFHAINNMDKVMLDDLVGYEIQKKKLVDNTEAFVQGRKSQQLLFYLATAVQVNLQVSRRLSMNTTTRDFA